MEQLPFLLETRKMMTRNDFFISSCNMDAVSWIDNFPEWNNNFATIIYGKKSSGKTHLCWLFSEKTNAKVYDAVNIKYTNFQDIIPINNVVAIDNIDTLFGDEIGEENLFHIINYSQECNTLLFLTTSTIIDEGAVILDELRDKLKQIPQTIIYEPDDELIKMLILKKFMDLNIAVTPEIVDYIAIHTDRTFENIIKTIEKINYKSLSQKHKITIPFIKSILNII